MCGFLRTDYPWLMMMHFNPYRFFFHLLKFFIYTDKYFFISFFLNFLHSSADAPLIQRLSFHYLFKSHLNYFPFFLPLGELLWFIMHSTDLILHCVSALDVAYIYFFFLSFYFLLVYSFIVGWTLSSQKSGSSFKP